MGLLEGKVAIITGAGQGLGEGAAQKAWCQVLRPGITFFAVAVKSLRRNKHLFTRLPRSFGENML